MSGEMSRRGFLSKAAAVGAGSAWAGGRATAGDAPSVTVCNPLLRTPLALIIDDSCPVINKAYYWMARSLTEVQSDAGGQERTIRLSTKFPADNFTLAIHDWVAKRVRCNGRDLQPVKSRRGSRSGTFLTGGSQTFVALDLPTGTTAFTSTR